MNRSTFSFTCRGWSDVDATIKSAGSNRFVSASLAPTFSANLAICSPLRICTDSVTARVRCHLPDRSRQQ